MEEEGGVMVEGGGLGYVMITRNTTHEYTNNILEILHKFLNMLTIYIYTFSL